VPLKVLLVERADEIVSSVSQINKEFLPTPTRPKLKINSELT